MGLFRRIKNNSKPLLRQILDLIPSHLIQRSIATYQSDKGCSRYKTYDQLVAMTFGQLNKCLTLSDISTGIGVSEVFIADLKLHQSPARSTMSDGNKNRDYRVFEGLYFKLLRYYERLLKNQHRSVIIKEIEGKCIKLIDSSTISLCLSLFDWAKFRTAKGGIKIHTCWDDNLQLPDMINITEAKLHDRYGLEQLIFPKGTIIVEDRAYFDFSLMLARVKAKNVFVTRMKNNTAYQSVAELELADDCPDNILKDELIELNGVKAIETGINKTQLRRIAIYKKEEDKVIVLITNNLDWKADTIGKLYKKRWDIELFFKALKQNLQVKTFIGTSENAVKSQIYIALICFLLLELIRRNTCKKGQAFSNFVEKVRICLTYYLSLDYICNQISQGAKRIRDKKPPELIPRNNLFSG